VGGGVEVVISDEHGFGTDAFLLSDFTAPKARESAVDLCSGCGIVPLLWFRGGTRPKTVRAVDIQERAVLQMRESAERSGLTDFFPIQADLRELGDMLPVGSANLVTCNPPYRVVGTGVMSESEVDQTARHETMCTLDDVLAASARLLRWGGRLCLCHLPERLADVLTAMRVHGVEPKRLRFAHAREDKEPFLLLVEGKRGAKPSLRVEPPLFLTVGGKTSPEMERIYCMYGYRTT
jgi:tRNA1(Val) A37 N6-methylase TrmN6